jgi:hypothetical protein
VDVAWYNGILIKRPWFKPFCLEYLFLLTSDYDCVHEKNIFKMGIVKLPVVDNI